MYMRFVRVKVVPDKMKALEQVYEQSISPALRRTEGCLFAGLIQNTNHPDECISLTMWSSPEAATAYEQSGLFSELLAETDPYRSDSSEWKIALSDDLTLELQPVKEPPVVHAFPLEDASTQSAPVEASGSDMYLRIVSARIQPGQFEAFKQSYHEIVIPALLATEGCRYAYLTRGVREEDEILSVTLWDHKAAADRYEQSGRFDELTERLRPWLSSLLQWKMELKATERASITTSEDLTVEGYRVVTGESF